VAGAALRTVNLMPMSHASFDVFVRGIQDFSPIILGCLTTLFRVPMLTVMSGTNLVHTCLCALVRLNIDGAENPAYDLQQIRPWQ
jgi:hypothetical protein